MKDIIVLQFKHKLSLEMQPFLNHHNTGPLTENILVASFLNNFFLCVCQNSTELYFPCQKRGPKAQEKLAAFKDTFSSFFCLHINL